MKRILYILILQLLMSNDFESIGTFTENANSFESISMSGSTTAWISGVSSIGSNPAGLTKLEGFGVDLGLGVESANIYNNNDAQFPYFSVGWGMKKPLIAGTDLRAAVGISYQARTSNGIEGWSPDQNYEGLFNFTESATSIAFAIDLNPVSFGFKWVNYSQDFGQYGSHNSEEFFKPIGFGLQYDLTKSLKFGIEISKVSKVGTYDYSIGKSKAGVSYTLQNNSLMQNNSLISIDYEKLSNDNGNLSLGYRRTLFNVFSLNAGFKNIATNEENYNHLSFGMSYYIKDIAFNLAMKQNLGSDINSPLSRIFYFSISYQFNNKNLIY